MNGGGLSRTIGSLPTTRCPTIGDSTAAGASRSTTGNGGMRHRCDDPLLRWMSHVASAGAHCVRRTSAAFSGVAEMSWGGEG
jgi:hypothetical protein